MKSRDRLFYMYVYDKMVIGPLTTGTTAEITSFYFIVGQSKAQFPFQANTFSMMGLCRDNQVSTLTGIIVVGQHIKFLLQICVFDPELLAEGLIFGD